MYKHKKGQKYADDDFPCENCDNVMNQDDMVFMIEGDEHYFCSPECAKEFTGKYLMMQRCDDLLRNGRKDNILLI